jgi:hypothetical protein
MEEEQKTESFEGYSGICHICGTPIERKELTECILTNEDEISWFVHITKNPLVCEYCLSVHTDVRIWKNMEVTSEFKSIRQENTNENEISVGDNSDPDRGGDTGNPVLVPSSS